MDYGMKDKNENALLLELSYDHFNTEIIRIKFSRKQGKMRRGAVFFNTRI